MSWTVSRGAGSSEANRVYEPKHGKPVNGKPMLGRRALLGRGGVVAAGILGAGALGTSAAPAASAASGPYQYIPVAAPLPSGDTSGKTDTAALNTALSSLAARESLLLTVPGYYINAPLSVKSSTGITSPIAFGNNGAAHITAATGFSGDAMIANHGWLSGSQEGDDGIEISNLFIDGSNGGSVGPFVSTNGHGIALSTAHSHVHHNFILNVSGTGILITDADSAGKPIDINDGSSQENYIWDNMVENPGQHCFWVTRTAGSFGMTDGVCARNIFTTPSFGSYYRAGTGNPQINPAYDVPYEAVRLDNGAGWWVTDNHTYYCPGGAYFFGTVFGTHFRDNTSDMWATFPYAVISGVLTPTVIIGVALHGVKCDINPKGTAANYMHPSSVTGNLINVFEGYNSAGTYALGYGTATSGCRLHYYDIAADTLAVPAGATGECGMVFLGNMANQNSVGGATVASCTTTSGSATVTAAKGAFANVQAGMSIGGTGIPAGTHVGTVTPGDSLTLVNTALTTPVDATASGTVTLNFPGPYSLAESWSADTAGVTMNVQHLGNQVFGSIISSPVVTTSDGATINMLAELGGVLVSGTPASGEVPVASGPNAATWGAASASSAANNATRGMIKSVVSLTPGTGASQGTPVVISAPSGAAGLDAVALQWAPNGASSETITLLVTATFDDKTTQSISMSATGNAAAQPSSGSEILDLAKDGHYATSFSVSAASSARSTSAAPSFTIAAIPVA
jgi:hypothetical protein